MSEGSDWPVRLAEEILEPELEICDAHHHLWDHSGRYLLDEFLADSDSGHRIRSTVFVECASMYRADGPLAMRFVGETEFVQGIAAMSASGAYGDTRVASAIVSRADLAQGESVREVLEAHVAASPNRFRGIRHVTAWDASDEIPKSHTRPTAGLLGDPQFRRGFAQLHALGLRFDAWLYHTQIGELAELARAFPDTTIVLDHYGGPIGIGPYAGKRDEVFAHWRRAIDDLATCENVVVKLGGIHMPINGFSWHQRRRPASSQEIAEATRPYAHHTIDRFGVSRCMFESNFPVDKVSCSYSVVWNSFKRIAEGFSASEKAALFRETAERVYAIEPRG